MATKRLTAAIRSKIQEEIKFFLGIEISKTTRVQSFPSADVVLSLIDSIDSDITYAVFNDGGRLLVGFGYSSWHWVGADFRKDFWSMIKNAEFSEKALKDTVFVVAVYSKKKKADIWPVTVIDIVNILVEELE